MRIALGPYVGDWKQEIFTFRPYMRWITNTVSHKDVFISAHSNRFFLYDWIPEDHKIPIYEDLTRNEFDQVGYIHLNLSKRDYTLLQKTFKAKVAEKDDLENFFLVYNSSTMWYPLYSKVFEKINVIEQLDLEDEYIVFIPDITESQDFLMSIYNSLKEEYNVVVIGDMKTHLSDLNVILKNPDYFEKSYEYIIEYISKARAVICPTSHWTLLCNLQKVPVFSWTANTKQYVFGGLTLENRHCCSVIGNDKSMIVSSFRNFVEKLRRK